MIVEMAWRIGSARSALTAIPIGWRSCPGHRNGGGCTCSACCGYAVGAALWPDLDARPPAALARGCDLAGCGGRDRDDRPRLAAKQRFGRTRPVLRRLRDSTGD